MPDYILKDINPNPIGDNKSPFIYDNEVALNASRNLINSKSFDILYDETGLDLEESLFEVMGGDLEGNIEYFFTDRLSELSPGVTVSNLVIDPDYVSGTYVIYADIYFEGLSRSIPIKKTFSQRG